MVPFTRGRSPFSGNQQFSRAQQWGSETAAVSHACRCRACLYTAVDCCPGRAQGGGAQRRTLAVLPWMDVVMEAARETLRAWSLPCFIFRKRGARSIAAQRRRDAPTDRNVPEQENKHLLPALPCAILRCIVWRLLRPVAAHCGVPMSSCFLCSRAPRAGQLSPPPCTEARGSYGSYGCHTDAATTTPFLQGRPGECRG